MRKNIARRDFLAAAAIGFGAPRRMLAYQLATPKPSAKAGPPKFMYVGSFTSGGRGKGEGISVFSRKSPTEPWTLVQVMSEFADPSFLAIDRQGRFLYSSHGGGTRVTSYRIVQSDGRLKPVNQQATEGTNGAHLAIDGTGRFVAVANYATGTLALLPIDADGSLGTLSDLATLTGDPGPHRTQQTSSHPHHCPFDRSGRFVVVPDKGLDRTFLFRLDSERGKLVPGNPASVASRPGAAPRHVDFHPSEPYAYVINELDSTMTAFHFDPDKQTFKPIQTLPTLPSTYTANNSTAEVVVAPSGRFVYGSNRGHDSIVIFAIEKGTGMLTPVGWESTQGRTPRYFGLDPSASHLYAANQNSDNVVIFRVDEATGKLTPTKEVVKVISPSTIVFR
jgi:6-phosphogluconolactonase (cycloisomerase 2 family)